jgi:hypothetical protein
MAANRKYAVVDPATGKLDRRIFGELAIYDEEMDHGWTYRNDGALDYVPGVRGLLPRARPAVSHRGPRRDLCGNRVRDLGRGRSELRGLFGRFALVSRHCV